MRTKGKGFAQDFIYVWIVMTDWCDGLGATPVGVFWTEEEANVAADQQVDDCEEAELDAAVTVVRREFYGFAKGQPKAEEEQGK